MRKPSFWCPFLLAGVLAGTAISIAMVVLVRSCAREVFAGELRVGYPWDSLDAGQRASVLRLRRIPAASAPR